MTSETELAPPDVPVVRMDKSSDYATVHGERAPGSVHAAVHFYQNNLPFDAQGFLIHDHDDFELKSPKPSKHALMIRERAEKLMARAAKRSKPKVEGEEAIADGDGEEQNEDDKGPANLEAWARGEARVPWNEVTQAIARRFSKRVSNKRDAIELMLVERIVAKGDLSDEHRKLVDE